MSIFKKKKEEKKEPVGKKKEPAAVSPAPETGAEEEKKQSAKTSGQHGASLDHVILRPRITEKATDAAAHNAYVFDIDPRANKADVSKAISGIYGVTPAKIHTIPVPSKAVFARGKKGMTAGGKKAIVYLKKGDKIEFV